MLQPSAKMWYYKLVRCIKTHHRPHRYKNIKGQSRCRRYTLLQRKIRAQGSLFLRIWYYRDKMAKKFGQMPAKLHTLLRVDWNVRNFADTFKFIYWIKYIIHVSVSFVPMGPVYNKSAFIKSTQFHEEIFNGMFVCRTVDPSSYFAINLHRSKGDHPCYHKKIFNFSSLRNSESDSK